jgi:hypothetical protein
MRHHYCVAGGAAGRVETVTGAGASVAYEGVDPRVACKGRSLLGSRRSGHHCRVGPDSKPTHHSCASRGDGSAARANNERVCSGDTTNNGREHGASMGSVFAAASASLSPGVPIPLATYAHTCAGASSLQGIDYAGMERLEASVRGSSLE